MDASEKHRRRRQIRYRLYKIVSIGSDHDPVSRAYDFFSTAVLIFNLVLCFLLTYDTIEAKCGNALSLLEMLTAVFFAVDFFLRLITVKCRYVQRTEGQAMLRYIFSFNGIVDILSFLPYFLPFFFPSGMVVFRMFRVVRIFRLFRLNKYYDSLNVIVQVLKSKRQQLFSSVFIIAILMLAASLCMYSIEHTAQPDVFKNAFSGVWWAVSALLTVGYGDIYPITPVGQFLSIIITFLGVLIIAIPTGIISAGFVEQYSRLKQIGDAGSERDVHFIRVLLHKNDSWVGQKIADLSLPRGVIIAMIQRSDEVIIPRGDVKLQPGDTVILSAEAMKNSQPVHLTSVDVDDDHSWNGAAIKDLNISRQTFILMIHRGKQTLIPNGNLVLHAGDEVILYSKHKPRGGTDIQI